MASNRFDLDVALVAAMHRAIDDMANRVERIKERVAGEGYAGIDGNISIHVTPNTKRNDFQPDVSCKARIVIDVYGVGEK
jgi:hypothetical protein